jgi:hypothetical protein
MRSFRFDNAVTASAIASCDVVVVRAVVVVVVVVSDAP